VKGNVPEVLAALGVSDPFDPDPELPALTDEHSCELYCWHVELCAAATPGSININSTPASNEMRFMNPFFSLTPDLF
jgi:hypothetical protein